MSTVFSSRTVYTERTNQQPQSGSGAWFVAKEKGILSCTGYRVNGYCLKIPIMPMMSDNEEDLDDFPAGNRDRPAESMVGAYRAESTD